MILGISQLTHYIILNTQQEFLTMFYVFLDTDTIVDIALYLMRIYGDDAELDKDELEQLTEYARIHGIEG